MWRRRMLLIAALACAGSMAVPIPGFADDAAQGAVAFVTGLSERTLKVLRDKSLGKDDRVKALSQIFLDGFDVRSIGLFVLGQYGRTASEADRTAYLDTFKDYVVQSYALRFNSYAGESFVVLTATPDGARGAWVSSGIGKPGEEPARVDWRVRKIADRYKIIDVVVEGVSLVVTQRSEFASVLQHNNGSLPGLTALMRDKITELKKKG